MHVLGFRGGLDHAGENLFELEGDKLSHNAAAVILRDGVVVAGSEEERFTRVKSCHRRETRLLHRPAQWPHGDGLVRSRHR